MKTISDQRDMIMRFADRDGDDSIQKEELGLFFSVAQSRRVQEIKVDVEEREAERKAEKDAEKQEQAKKPDDGGSTDGSTGCCWLLWFKRAMNALKCPLHNLLESLRQQGALP